MQSNYFTETNIPGHAKLLNALHKLDLYVRLEAGQTATLPESICFAHPTGTMYEADMLTWQYLSISGSCIVHAINNKAYGSELGEELHSTIFGAESQATELVSEQDVFGGLVEARRDLFEIWKQQ